MEQYNECNGIVGKLRISAAILILISILTFKAAIFVDNFCCKITTDLSTLCDYLMHLSALFSKREKKNRSRRELTKKLYNINVSLARQT